MTHWSTIEFMGGRWNKIPSLIFFPDYGLCPQRARISQLNRLSSTLNTELSKPNFKKSPCFYHILIISATNDDKNTCHKLLVLHHLILSQPTVCLSFNILSFRVFQKRTFVKRVWLLSHGLRVNHLTFECDIRFNSKILANSQFININKIINWYN